MRVLNKKNSFSPDFLIVGAAKAGTTSLFHYLEQHPSIFLPKLKEPKYFVSEILNLPQNGKGDDLTDELMIKNFKEYLNLFNDKNNKQICGEASVDYLYYSKDSIPLIKRKIGNPKIVIVLRNPVKRAFSAYNHLIRDLREKETFERALELEELRINSNFEFIWHYKKAGLYYNNVKDYLDHFTDVKVIIFEEFIMDPLKIVQELYLFLGVDEGFVPDVSRKLNFTGKPKIKLLQILLKGSPNQLSRKLLKTILNEKTRLIIREKLERLNISKVKLIMSQNIKEKLYKFYEEDISKLEKLLNIKLKKYWE